MDTKASSWAEVFQSFCFSSHVKKQADSLFLWKTKENCWGFKDPPGPIPVCTPCTTPAPEVLPSAKPHHTIFEGGTSTNHVRHVSLCLYRAKLFTTKSHSLEAIKRSSRSQDYPTELFCLGMCVTNNVAPPTSLYPTIKMCCWYLTVMELWQNLLLCWGPTLLKKINFLITVLLVAFSDLKTQIYGV